MKMETRKREKKKEIKKIELTLHDFEVFRMHFTIHKEIKIVLKAKGEEK